MDILAKYTMLQPQADLQQAEGGMDLTGNTSARDSYGQNQSVLVSPPETACKQSRLMCDADIIPGRPSKLAFSSLIAAPTSAAVSARLENTVRVIEVEYNMNRATQPTMPGPLQHSLSSCTSGSINASTSHHWLEAIDEFADRIRGVWKSSLKELQPTDSTQVGIP